MTTDEQPPQGHEDDDPAVEADSDDAYSGAVSGDLQDDEAES